jgi:hypothetical protein
MFQIMQTQKQINDSKLDVGSNFMGYVIVRIEPLLPSGYRKVVLK